MKFNSGRPAIERMQTIARLLRMNKPFNASRLACRFEVDRRTISRDMIFMRDRLGWDFSYIARLGRYRLNSAPEPML